MHTVVIIFSANFLPLAARLCLEEGKQAGKGLPGFGIYAPNHGQAQERRVCVLSGYEPWDPAASLADQPLRRRAATAAPEPLRRRAATAAPAKRAMGAHGAPMAGIGGERFSGKPSDWPDTKTELIAWFAAHGFSYIPQMGTCLFHLAGSGDYDHVEDADLNT